MRRDGLFRLADWLTDPPSGGPIEMWTVGGFLSALITWYGLSCCLAKHAITVNITMRGFRPLSDGLWLDIYGWHAVTFGLCFVCVGLFVHFQWFWGIHRRLRTWYEIPKYIAVLCLVIAGGAHVYTMMWTT